MTVSKTLPAITSRVIYSLTGCMLAMIFLLSSCKKDKNNNELPTFGTCKPVATKGHLSYVNASGPYTFRTSGGGTITISELGQIVIKHDSYPGFQLEFWGGDPTPSNPTGKMSDNHENLNGKHIKDRIAARRTVIFPDGAKITFAAPLPNPLYPPLIFISIYDGAEFHRINPNCNTVEYSTIDAAMAKRLDDAEEDGEASSFTITATGLLWDNIYTEDTPGNKIMNKVPLGELERSNPTLVRDYYDDPRLGHT